MSNGTNPKDRVGVSKISLTRVPATALIEMAKAGTYGNFMYDPFNWRDRDKKIGFTVYMDALLRHIFRLFDGEEVDADSLVSHWGHIAQTCAVAIDAIAMGNYVDDRPPKGMAAEAMKQFEEDLPRLKAHWEITKAKKQAALISLKDETVKKIEKIRDEDLGFTLTGKSLKLKNKLEARLKGKS